MGATKQQHRSGVELQLHTIRARLRRIIEASASVDRDNEATPVELATQSRTAFPVCWLADRLGLEPSEEWILWVLIAHELCPSSRRMIRELSSEAISDPTLDTIRRIVYRDAASIEAWQQLAADGSLRRTGLIERMDGSDDVPEHRQTFKVARRVLALVHGDLSLDPELAKLAGVEPGAAALEELEVGPDVVRELEAALDGEPGLIILCGGVGSGRRSLLAALAKRRGLHLLAVDGRAIATEREPAERQLRILARECALFGLVPLIRNLDAMSPSGDIPDRLDLVDAELDGLVLATTKAKAISRRWKRPPISIDLPPLAGAQRAILWSRALPAASEADAELLATMYPLAPSMIDAVGKVAVRRCGDAAMRPHHVEAGLRSVLDDRLAGLATRIAVTQTWDDLVLPDDQATAVVELLARIRKRRLVHEDWGFAQKVGKGLGVSALFSGPPGTGKTMCAGLIARDLRTELYQVDLSKISSKWIGDTEKNLAAVFDAAEGGHAILLFDEADALFGKRTEVRTSNDRHANQQVNYLLTRLESFAGICILTTNHDASIDEAFRRRLSVHVRFQVPDADERQRIWKAMIPQAAPIAGDLRLDKLAETYVMSGGYIRNAVLRAAFLAAEEGTPIDGTHLKRAAQLEYEAMGKLA